MYNSSKPDGQRVVMGSLVPSSSVSQIVGIVIVDLGIVGHRSQPRPNNIHSERTYVHWNTAKYLT